jgi:hypothetical protein
VRVQRLHFSDPLEQTCTQSFPACPILSARAPWTPRAPWALADPGCSDRARPAGLSEPCGMVSCSQGCSGWKQAEVPLLRAPSPHCPAPALRGPLIPAQRGRPLHRGTVPPWEWKPGVPAISLALGSAHSGVSLVCSLGRASREGWILVTWGSGDLGWKVKNQGSACTGPGEALRERQLSGQRLTDLETWRWWRR